MTDKTENLIEHLLKNPTSIVAQDIAKVARCPEALEPSFLITQISLLKSSVHEQTKFIDVLMYNDHWLERFLSEEGLFSTESHVNKYWQLERGLSTSIAAYVALKKPNELLEALIKQSTNPFELFDRRIYPGVLMRLLDELGARVNVQVLNRFLTKFAVVDSVSGFMNHASDLCYLMTKVPHADLLENLSLNGIKSTLLAKTRNSGRWEGYGDSYPIFVFYSKLKNDKIEDMTLAFSLIKTNVDIQLAGAKPWFVNFEELTKAKFIEMLHDKREAVMQIAAMKGLIPETDKTDFTLHDLSMTLANNAVAISGKSIYDDDNALFIEQLTAQTKLLMAVTNDFEERYQDRNDSAAMFVTAMLVHEKTRRIFSETIGDACGPEEHFKLDY